MMKMFIVLMILCVYTSEFLKLYTLIMGRLLYINDT